jgi:hypothetical protein
MSAARLDLDWNGLNGVVGNAVAFMAQTSLHLVRRIGPTHRPGRCPGCHSIIYSRRHKLCGVCGQPLPGELLFSPAEAEQVKHLLRAEQARHRKWVKGRL